MKTKLSFLIIGLCSLFTVQAQQWGYVNTLTDEWMRKICTQGLDTVFIVGENGLIAKSTDRGETWKKQHLLTQVAFNDVLFIDHNIGFIVGAQGTILKTMDASENWTQLTTGTTTQINAIAAAGLDNIWAVGDNSLVLHSIDIGNTWQQVTILPENDRQLLDIEFRGNLGYFSGDCATVYKTEDYGTNWAKQTLIDNSENYFQFHSINMTENKSYMMCENDLFFTNDQINWDSYNLYVPGYSNYKLFFLNDIVGYRVTTYNGLTTGSSDGTNYGYLPEILNTDNGGDDWNSYWDKDWNNIKKGQYPDNYPYLDIVLVNENIGYAIFGQSLLKTPSPIPNVDKIEKITNNDKLSIFQPSQDELLLKSLLNPILSIKVFDISGKECFFQQWENPEMGEKINIGHLSVDIYIIKTTMSDNIISINKWIKQ
ncbi:hypothetical protein FACS189413_14650 [Bacteroidia bacterium]|nr:hypothetical protein FACS189413_14650 [Bacteroidia bacterium]